MEYYLEKSGYSTDKNGQNAEWIEHIWVEILDNDDGILTVCDKDGNSFEVDEHELYSKGEPKSEPLSKEEANKRAYDEKVDSHEWKGE